MNNMKELSASYLLLRTLRIFAIFFVLLLLMQWLVQDSLSLFTPVIFASIVAAGGGGIVYLQVGLLKPVLEEQDPERRVERFRQNHIPAKMISSITATVGIILVLIAWISGMQYISFAVTIAICLGISLLLALICTLLIRRLIHRAQG